MRDGEGAWPVDAATALGMALRRARTKYACSLRDLGQKGGVSESYLSRVENAQERPSDRILMLYARSFRVDADELFRLAGRMPPDMVAHLVESPKRVKKIRAEMAEKATRNGKRRACS